MELQIPKHSITIAEFYKGKNVFLTGGTGFLGKVLIEKLLRDCPDIGKIYILVRPKKGKSLTERVEIIFQDQLYDTLKESNPTQLTKLIPLAGDCIKLNLGLSEHDYQLITSSVNIIYHVAASVRFDDDLKSAILLNTRGTREIATLALKTSALSAFVHISTTYCNCVYGEKIKEDFYPPPTDWRKAIEIAEHFNKGDLAAFQDKYLGDYPNTYTFTKALGEHVIKDLLLGNVPAIICRPSIVVSTVNDPVEGWIDNYNGPVGLLIASGKGLLRISYQKDNVSADYMPVDLLIKAIIVASWDTALRRDLSTVEVLNCSSGEIKWLTVSQLLEICREVTKEIPLENALWVPKGDISLCKYYAYICFVLFHLIPAMFLDFGLKLAGHKSIITRLQTKIYGATLQLRYFTMQEWTFENKKFIALIDKILENDTKTWSYNFDFIDKYEFVKNSVKGGRRYLLKEPDSSIPQAKIHYNRMYWVDKVAMTILYGSITWYLISHQMIETVFNYVCRSIYFYFDGADL